jgi:hypothetical protein
MEQNFPPWQPAPRIEDQPPDLPALIVKQEVADGADLAVACLDGVTHKR